MAATAAAAVDNVAVSMVADVTSACCSADVAAAGKAADVETAAAGTRPGLVLAAVAAWRTAAA